MSAFPRSALALYSLHIYTHSDPVTVGLLLAVSVRAAYSGVLDAHTTEVPGLRPLPVC